MIQIPRANVQRWLANMHDNDPARGSVLEWATILDTRSLDEILELITTDNENAARLRQSAPFAGILTPQEVWRLKQEFSRAPRPA